MTKKTEAAIKRAYQSGKAFLNIAEEIGDATYDEVKQVIDAEGPDFRRLYGPASHRTKPEYTDDQMIRFLQTAYNEIHPNGGEALTMPRYEEWRASKNIPHIPAGITITRRFKKWCLACDEAGIPCTWRKRTGGITRDDCGDALLEAKNRLGHLPSYNEYGDLWRSDLKYKGHPSGPTIRVKFDKWRNALQYVA